jgi:hypothetical protein
MNSLVFVLFCLVFLGNFEYFSAYNNLFDSNYLVVQQDIEAINCYICDPGTNGCGPSFNKNGGGVLPMSDSSAAYCTVRIYWYSHCISSSFVYRNWWLQTTTMLLSVPIQLLVPVLKVAVQVVMVLIIISIVVQRNYVTEL